MSKPQREKNMIDQVVGQIKDTLRCHDVDFQGIIDEFGQVRAFEDRLQGKSFTLNEHVRGLVLAQLSNQRTWGPIAANLAQIDQIFCHYDAETLKSASPTSLTAQLIEIRCGNRKIAAQMEHLARNIEMFETLANEFGSVDAFVTSQEPARIAKELGSGKRYKLKEIAFTLAMEYLRNVGINAIKPDLHICRLIGPQRFGFIDKEPTPEQAYACLMRLADESAENAVYLDTLLWIFAAKDYGNICTATPRCGECSVMLCAKHPSK
jgi:hypothetical protein